MTTPTSEPSPSPATPTSPMAPLVSIVLPVHNGARYLPEALASVTAQTWREWELICVDDASSDDTPAMLAEYAQRDPRIRIVRHARNTGLPGALNTGFAAASGDLLTWTSDDNRYRPEALSTFVNHLQASPDVAFVYSDFAHLDENGRITGLSVAPTGPEGLITGREGMASFLYRRAVYEQVGDYATDLTLAEDYDYWLRVLAAGFTMAPVHETLYDYRFHSRSLTEAHRDRTFVAAERALRREMPALVRRYPGARGVMYLRLASLASWRHQRALAAWYALQSAFYSPRRLLAQTGAYVRRRLSARPRAGAQRT